SVLLAVAFVWLNLSVATFGYLAVALWLPFGIVYGLKANGWLKDKYERHHYKLVRQVTAKSADLAIQPGRRLAAAATEPCCPPRLSSRAPRRSRLRCSHRSRSHSPGRRGRFGSLRLTPQAGQSTFRRASSRRGFRRRSASRWWSRTGPARAATS